jgi:adenylate cyclase
VLRQGEDFFGRHVNLAARVASSARPGEIQVSSLMQALVSGDHELRLEGPRSVELKGFERPELVYQIVWTLDPA